MSSRKAHKKSRKGCTTCKRRHQKCGEEHPVCHNCIELELPCHFPPPVSLLVKKQTKGGSNSPCNCGSQAPKTNSQNSSETQSQSRDQSHASEPETDINTSDLELLHHFSTSAYLTLTKDPEEQRIGQTTLITIGFRHKFLLRGILALSALHLSYLNTGSTSNEYMLKASYHQNVGLADFRKALGTIDASTFDAVLGFSCLLPVHSMAAAASPVARQMNPEQDMLSAFLNALSLVRSVNHLLLPSLQIYTSTLSPILMAAQQKLPKITSSYPGIHSIQCLSHAVALHLNSSGASQKEIETFDSTLELLASTLAHTLGNSNPRGFTIGSVLVWTISVSDEYCKLLSERHPCALAILAHFAVLLHRHNNVWWLQGLGAAIISRVGLSLGIEWSEALAWPQKEAAH